MRNNHRGPTLGFIQVSLQKIEKRFVSLVSIIPIPFQVTKISGCDNFLSIIPLQLTT